MAVTNPLGYWVWGPRKWEQKGQWDEEQSPIIVSLGAVIGTILTSRNDISTSPPCIHLSLFTICSCPITDLMIVLGKEMYTHRCTSTFMHIYYYTHMHYMCGFGAHQVSSGLCPLLLLLLCPCTSWGTSNSTFIVVLVLCFAVYNMLFVRHKGDGDYHPLLCGLVEGGTIPTDTQNTTWVALYEGSPPGQCGIEITTGISLGKFNPTFTSSVLFAGKANMFLQYVGRKSMLTDIEVQNSIGTRISESIESPILYCYMIIAGK